MVEGAPAEAVSELESCQVWEGNDEPKADAEVEELAARLKSLAMDHDLVEVNRQQFVAGKI